MKILKSLLAIALLLTANFISAKTTQVYLSYNTFYNPDKGPYVETYLSVNAGSIHFTENEEGLLQGKLEVIILFKQNDTIVNFKKYNLMSPVIENKSKTNFSFIDQQRFALPNGRYLLELKVKDLNAEENPIYGKDSIFVSYNRERIDFSGIEFLESYKPTIEDNTLSKSGFDLVPYAFTYFPDNVSKIAYYSELYNTDKTLGKDKKFLLKSYIESFETKQIMNGFVKQKVIESAPVVPFLNEFSLEELPSGNYNLVMEAINQENEVIAKNYVFFQRSNPGLDKKLITFSETDISNTFVSKITNKDSLMEYIAMLRPISTQREKYTAEDLIQNGTDSTLKHYFYHFWKSRDPYTPGKNWQRYKKRVMISNDKYSSLNKKGYETDRGITFIKYGEPNTIVESPYGPATTPYEIWHYYALNSKYSNAKFIFYNPNLATNDYDMIHSNVPGEVSNPQWQYLLFKVPPGVDEQPIEDKFLWGERTFENYKDPK